VRTDDLVLVGSTERCPSTSAIVSDTSIVRVKKWTLPIVRPIASDQRSPTIPAKRMSARNRPGTSSARRTRSSSDNVPLADGRSDASLMPRTGERRIRSASTAALRTAASTPRLVRTVAGASRSLIASTARRTSSGVMLPSGRWPSVGRKWVRSTESSRVLVVARFPASPSSHCRDHSATVIWPPRGSRCRRP
jgi:hypothetical protein